MIIFTALSLSMYIGSIFLSKDLTAFSQLLLAFPTIFYLYKAYKNEGIHLSKSAYCLLAFIFIAIISIILNLEEIKRPSGHYNLLRTPLLTVLGIIPFSCWMRKASFKLKYWLINIFFLSLIVSAIYGLWAYFQYNQTRLSGLLYITNQGYASALILSLMLPALLFENIRKYFSFNLAIFAFLLTFLVMILTLTRGALLGLACSLPITLYFYRKKWAYYSASFLAIALLSLGSYYFFGSKNLKLRYIVTKENNSDIQRRSVWIATFYAIKERPILGWGYLNLENHMESIKKKYDLPVKEYNSHSHNNFLEVFAGTGLIGLIAFLLWLLTWTFEIFKGSLLNKVLMLPFLATFLVTGQFDITIDKRLSVILFCLYTLSSYLQHTYSEDQNLNKVGKN